MCERELHYRLHYGHVQYPGWPLPLPKVHTINSKVSRWQQPFGQGIDTYRYSPWPVDVTELFPRFCC